MRIERAEASLLHYRLDRPVGGSNVSSVDVIVVDLTDSSGAPGLGFSYVIGGGGEVVLAAVRQQLDRYVAAQTCLPPQALWRRIAASFNRTGLGPNLLALSAIDVAAWDLEARRRGVPLGVAMGGAPRPVRVYGSGGFHARQSPEEAAATAAAHAACGLTAVKPRLSGDAPTDVMVMSAVRSSLPDHVATMFDANEKCDLASARRLLHAARDQGALFVEEPLPAGAIEGYRALARAGGAAVAVGEHLQGRQAFHAFLSERLVAIIQPDLAMAGGLTPILEVAALADAFDVGVAPHFLPGLFVHLGAATPAMTWLEDFPLLEPLFEGWPEMQSDGTMMPRDVAGHGISLSAANRRTFAV
jgi:L-alanine-DL-glutamate epimerase-like enolase superfamily enzyme